MKLFGLFGNFTRGELALISGILLLLAATARQQCRLGASPEPKRKACMYFLRDIQAAKMEWSARNGEGTTNAPTLEALISTNGMLRYKPVCPSGGEYNVGAIGTDPRCSFERDGHRL